MIELEICIILCLFFYKLAPSVWSAANAHDGAVHRETALRSNTNSSGTIGRVSLARENEAGGSWGQEVHILHVNV